MLFKIGISVVIHFDSMVVNAELSILIAIFHFLNSYLDSQRKSFKNAMLRFGTVNLKFPYKAYGSHGKSSYRIQFNQIDEVLQMYRLP